MLTQPVIQRVVHSITRGNLAGTIGGGNLALDASGRHARTITQSTAISVAAIGIMDSSKSIGALFLTYNPVEYAFMMLIKAGGIFALSDLEAPGTSIWSTAGEPLKESYTVLFSWIPPGKSRGGPFGRGACLSMPALYQSIQPDY